MTGEQRVRSGGRSGSEAPIETPVDTQAEANVSGLLAAGKPVEDAGVRRDMLLAQLFPQEMARPKMGRYDVLEFIGEGGMGTVYAAYDPQLDRRVAVKVLRRTAGEEGEQRRARLLREAKALARLSHPNIVAVHEVWEDKGEIHLAMEFVRGQDLSQWHAEPREWSEVVKVYRKAGEGLAAAHAAGLVHRDFKPHNVILRDDGEVKLLDFGLARIGPEAPDEEVRSGSERASSSEDWETRTGTIMGTPAYMAPEQRQGEPADARSDQYSFCVALWEALYGERPTVHHSAESASSWSTGRSSRSSRTGPVSKVKRPEAARDRRVPSWVRRVVERGLATRPDARHPSMRALLRDLGRDPARRRRRVLAAFGGIVATLAGGVAVAEFRSQTTSCVAPVSSWTAGVQDDVRRGVSQAAPDHADQTWELLAPRLARHVQALERARSEACELHRRGLLPDSLYARRVACLERRGASFDTLVDLLRRGDASAVSNANKAAAELPTAQSCAAPDESTGASPLPDDPEEAARVEALFEELARASTEESAGLYVEAEARASEVLFEARRLEYAPLVTAALVRWGSAGMQAGRAESVERLDEALWLSIETEQRSSAAEAAAKRIFARLELEDRNADVDDALELARSLVERSGAADWRTRWVLHNNTGIALEYRGETTQALAAYEAALQVVSGQEEEQGRFERAVTYSNMAPIQVRAGEASAASESAEAAVDQLTALLGSEHPQLRVAQASRAAVLRVSGRYAEADALLREVLARFTSDDPAPLWMLAEATRIARLRGESGETQRWIDRARTRLSSGDGLWRVFFEKMAAEVAVAGGDEAGLDVLERLAEQPEQREDILRSLVGLYLDLGRISEARRALDRLLEIEGAQDPPTRITNAQVNLAEGQPARALELLQELVDDAGSKGLEPLESMRALETMALAHAELGDAEQTRAWTRRALQVAEGIDSSPAVERIRQRLRPVLEE